MLNTNKIGNFHKSDRGIHLPDINQRNYYDIEPPFNDYDEEKSYKKTISNKSSNKPLSNMWKVLDVRDSPDGPRKLKYNEFDFIQRLGFQEF